MPKRNDINSILILGSGPIIIGQSCEFDYSGTQACKALKKEGYRTILVNSNPATIMTDPEMADATYIEPMNDETLIQIIEKEKPDAILPTVGGQTALNLVMDLYDKNYLQNSEVILIGANIEAIRKAESRSEFKKAMVKIGMNVPMSALCNSMSEARAFQKKMGIPLIIRPSFTLGGLGGGIAFTEEEFEEICINGLRLSPTNEILIEQSVLGWKEFELEVMRDHMDNVVIICSIENLDPMGVHTGDSITVAPQQTLSDKYYQKMRDAAIKIIREIGVETGGSNIQFAVNPVNGDMIVIEMNPRVSRSSALASKATGFPIAKIAALLAVGYSLNEISNDITQKTPASFEPTIDYVVTKVPRFAFEKFPGASNTLDSQMHAVGESMAIGRTFKESIQKAMRSLEISRMGLGSDGEIGELLEEMDFRNQDATSHYKLLSLNVSRPTPERIFYVKMALTLGVNQPESGFSVQKVHELSGIDPWFLNQITDLIKMENEYKKQGTPLDFTIIRELKQSGFSDRQIAYIRKTDLINENLSNINEKNEQSLRKDTIQTLIQEEKIIKQYRYENNIFPVYKTVDTCAGEFEAYTPYLYSTYEDEDESRVNQKKKVMILGGGPNRIGQGIEFDYCCCHASFALQKAGIESIMVNSNPETVSTDYDTSDKLYFEPLTLEDVLHICNIEKPWGVILSFGGQTPLSLAKGLEAAGINILGTAPDAIDRAEDRDRFGMMLNKLELKQPANGMAKNYTEALAIVEKIGYPCLVRPSYVLGGRAMAIVYDNENLNKFVIEAESLSPGNPVLIDKFLENAYEVDVDAISDGIDVMVAGIMQHVEQAGIHSGDSACILPPTDLSDEIIKQIKDATRKIAIELNVIGLLNIQFAVQNNNLFIIEVNPRASRTVPFVSKAIGMPLPAIATQVMCQTSLKDLGLNQDPEPKYFSVKEAVLPFNKFPGSDIILGPEMKSTGEVMGIAKSAGEAYIKAVMGSDEKIPSKGGVFISVNNASKESISHEAKILKQSGYEIYATRGTAKYLIKQGLEVIQLYKLKDKKQPNAVDEIRSGNINIIINIPDNRKTRDDSFAIRQEAIKRRVLCVTTAAASKSLIQGLGEMHNRTFSVESLQSMHSK